MQFEVREMNHASDVMAFDTTENTLVVELDGCAHAIYIDFKDDRVILNLCNLRFDSIKPNSIVPGKVKYLRVSDAS